MKTQFQGSFRRVGFGCIVALSAFIADSAQAEIDILKADPKGDNFYSPMSLSVGGSIRPRFRNDMGGADTGQYWQKGYDGGTRFRITTGYHFDEDLKVVGYWEFGTNIFKVADMDSHYPKKTSRFNRRELYAGLDSEKWGRLTYGKQDSVYYQTVGVKTDVWENDWHAKAAAVGVYPAYDGSDKPDRTLMYKLTRDDADFYAMAYLPTHSYYTPGGWMFHRKKGAALGVDWRTTKTLTLSASYTRIKVTSWDAQTKHSDYEQIAATSIAWAPGPWYAALSGEYYGNFIPQTMRKRTDYNFFAGDAYGATAFLSRTFPVDKGPLLSIGPYVAGTRLEILGGEHYHANQLYTGVNFQFRYGFRVAVERTFSSSTDHLPDSNWLDFYYDF